MVFVDEYQDTNGIQEAIFSLIERDNIFVVGDVKQSIYGFRGSDSDIFLNGLKNHEADGKTTVNLSVNFRSTKGVLSCVNNVFGDIMTNESFGNRLRRRAYALRRAVRRLYGKCGYMSIIA